MADDVNRSGPRATARRGSPAAYLGMGNRQSEAGRLDHAMAQYRKALALDPAYAEAHNNLGVILHRQGRLEEAAAAFGQALILVPEDADAHLNQGNVRFAQGRLDQAAVHFRQAVALKPDQAEAHLNLGVVLLQQGRLEDAHASTRRALALAPDMVDGYRNLGAIAGRMNRLEEALACYRRALALKPDDAGVLMNLAVALVQMDRLDEAVTGLRRALTLDPNHPGIHRTLGNALMKQADQGRADRRGVLLRAAAADCYRQVVVLCPGDAAAYHNLGIALLHLDRLEEAAGALGQALALRPADAETLNNLGVALFRLGRLDEAAACYRQALVLKPEYVEAHFNQSEVRRFRPGDPELAALEALAADADGLSSGQAVHLHFALGKALEDVGEHARAFGHFLAGNAARRRLLAYDEAALRAQFSRMAAVFEAGLFDRCRGGGDPSSVPVFVVGMPRSGSTLVEQILASHPQVLGAGELTDLAEVAKFGLGPDQPEAPFPDYLGRLDRAALGRLGRAYLARLPALPPGRTRITDKMPDNFMLIGLIRLILPEAPDHSHGARPGGHLRLVFFQTVHRSAGVQLRSGRIGPLLPLVPRADGPLAPGAAPGQPDRGPLRGVGGRSGDPGPASDRVLRSALGPPLPVVPRDPAGDPDRQRGSGPATAVSRLDRPLAPVSTVPSAAAGRIGGLGSGPVRRARDPNRNAIESRVCSRKSGCAALRDCRRSC